MNTAIQQKHADGPPIGLFGDITNAEYHRGKGISKSGLDLIRQSPEHYITNRRNPRPSTPAMILGTAFHCLLLEPDLFEQVYVMEPVDAPKRPTKTQINAKKPSPETLAAIAFWEEWDAENGDKTPISTKPGDDPFWQPSDWCRLHRMRDAVMMHPIASILLDPDAGTAEQTCYWVDSETKKLCKCRPDFLNEAHRLAIDLKSTEDASYTGFGQSVGKYRYNVQDPFYRDGLSAAGYPTAGFVFIACEKLPPYGVACYQLDEDARRSGRYQYEADLRLYAQCMAENRWPVYPDEVRTLELSPWQARGRIS